MFFAASLDGLVHQVNLFRERDSRHGGKIIEAVGGAGATDVVHVDDDAGKMRLITMRYVAASSPLILYRQHIQ